MGGERMSEKDVMVLRSSLKTSEGFIQLEDKHGAQNYAPIPVVLSKGSGCYLYDPNGKEYIDFLAAYSAVNQGHCHPKIVAAVKEQLERLSLTSRAFHSDMLAVYSKFVTEFFGYDRVLPMNTGVEAAETSIKLCRKWAYAKKGIAENQAKVIFAEGNFWGRSIAACSSSTDPECFGGFGPFTPGFVIIPFDDVDALKKTLEGDKNIAGFIIEPIQGEAGVRIPSAGYLKKVQELCKQHNVLLIADEIQSGLGRTGKMLCCEHEGVKPDILVLGKALSGGTLPVSAVLASHEVMLCIRPGQHGSTYGGCPVACRAAIAALTVIKEENLCDNSEKLGQIFRTRMQPLVEALPWVKEVRGRGLMNAIEVHPKTVRAWDICLRLRDEGLLCKPTHEVTVRFTPPLVITEAQLQKSCDIILNVFKSMSVSS